MDNGLISPDLYAAIVLAVLLSTIVPPFCLRFTISHYDKLAQSIIKQAEEMEKKRGKKLDMANLSPEEKEQLLRVSEAEHWTTRLSCIYANTDYSCRKISRPTRSYSFVSRSSARHRGVSFPKLSLPFQLSNWRSLTTVLGTQEELILP